MIEVLKVIKRDAILLPPGEGATEGAKAQHERLMFVAKWMWDCLFAQAGGASKFWRKAVRKNYIISEARVDGLEAFPPNSEAFAALAFENGYTAEPGAVDNEGNPTNGKWHEYFKVTNGFTLDVKLPRSSKADDPEGVYEGRYSSSKAGSSAFGGWGDNGLRRFKDLQKLVKESRAQDHAKLVERAILARVRKDIYKIPDSVDAGTEDSKKRKRQESSVNLDEIDD
ncbi:unknown protein [Seminavis robusta]|uniref:Uncharacterized protein n=1 Tax=Seminavis robusta TaxID=568900 RepID=A0A9N8DAJ6_9STRA|nr:unknown protein [Seminavis robusta]|eukprot:Sro66_g182911.1  (226) ;mRNA; f:553-1230